MEGSPEKLNQLERKCLLLQQQVYEMEASLGSPVIKGNANFSALCTYNVCASNSYGFVMFIRKRISSGFVSASAVPWCLVFKLMLSLKPCFS